MTVQKISETIQKFDGVSYYRCGPYFQRKGKRLHRVVWEKHNGPIPEDCDVHHINGDRTDNDIENLQLLPQSEHHKEHMSRPERHVSISILPNTWCVGTNWNKELQQGTRNRELQRS